MSVEEIDTTAFSINPGHLLSNGCWRTLNTPPIGPQHYHWFDYQVLGLISAVLCALLYIMYAI